MSFLVKSFPFGQPGPFVVPGDLQITEPYPKLVQNGTETNGQWTERVEIAGSIWVATNATYSGSWSQVDPSKISTAFVLPAGGGITTYSSPAGTNPIVWTTLFNVSTAGFVTSSGGGLAPGAALANIGVAGISSLYFAAGAAATNLGNRSVVAALLARADQLTQIGYFSVKDYGALGDGVTNDTISIQAAQTAAVATGAELYFPPGTYIVGTLALTAACRFEAGAILSPSTGTTTTFTGSINAPAVRIFLNVGTGNVVVGGTTPFVYPEWFGAKGDGANDDTAAINTAILSLASGAGFYQAPSGRVQFLAKTYAHTGTINVNRGNITLAGLGVDMTFLQTPANSSTTNLSVNGTGNTQAITLRDFSLICGPSTFTSPFVSSGTNTSTAKGLSMQNCVLCEVVAVNSYQHGTNFYITAVTNCNFTRCKGYTTNSTAANLYMWFLDGTNVVQSCRFLNCQGYCPSYTGAGFSFNFYSVGPHMNDQYVEGCEFNSGNFGIYYDCTLATGVGQSADIRILHNTVDQNSIDGIYIKNAPAGSLIRIADNWVGGQTAGGQILLSACHGVVVSGNIVSAILANTGAYGIVATSCLNCAIVHNVVNNQPNPITVNNNSSHNTVANNTIYLASGVAQKNQIGIYVLTTSPRNTIMGNTVDSGAGAASYSYGIALGPGCDYCNVIGNQVNPAVATTTIFSDTGNTHGSTLGVTT